LNKYSKFFEIIIALFLAFVLWIYVVITTNPLVVRTIEVPVRVVNLNKSKFMLGYISPTVKVKVLAQRLKFIEYLGTKFQKIKAVINLKDFQEGTYDLLPKIIGAKDFKEIYPQKVKIKLIKLHEKRLNIKCSLFNSPKYGYYVEDLKLIPEAVWIQGKKEIVDKVVHAVISVKLKGVNRDFIENHKVSLLDKNSKPLSKEEFKKITVLPEKVTVKVSVKKWPVKSLKIKSILKGKPAYGYEIKKVKISPETLKITGMPENILKFNIYKLPSVDINGITKTKYFEFPVTLKNVKILQSDKIRMTVEVVPVVGDKEYDDIPIECKLKKIKYTLFPVIAKVRVVAPILVLEKLTKKDIKVYINPSNLKPGRYKLIPIAKCLIKNTCELEVLEPRQVTLKIYTSHKNNKKGKVADEKN